MSRLAEYPYVAECDGLTCVSSDAGAVNGIGLISPVNLGLGGYQLSWVGDGEDSQSVPLLDDNPVVFLVGFRPSYASFSGIPNYLCWHTVSSITGQIGYRNNTPGYMDVYSVLNTSGITYYGRVFA